MPKEPRWDRVTGNVITVRNLTGVPLELRGVSLSDLDVWRLSSALDGSIVEVIKPPSAYERAIYFLDGDNPSRYSSASSRRIEWASEDKADLIVVNRGYYLNDTVRGQGHAWAALALQVSTAHRLGFSAIETHAQGNAKGSLTSHTGYLQWPKFGFDATIPSEVQAQIGTTALDTLGLGERSTIVELIATPKGLALWQRFGVACTLTLRLKPLSSSAASLLKVADRRPQHLIR